MHRRKEINDVKCLTSMAARISLVSLSSPKVINSSQTLAKVDAVKTPRNKANVDIIVNRNVKLQRSNVLIPCTYIDGRLIFTLYIV